ncbi:MAG: hypothetical protein JWQ04_1470 [Pedosphaera sp.]|nr:hypothetical protein [Pedosphaera sp.]
MNDQDYHQLRELSWRRPLTPAEEAALQTYLATNPPAREDWQIETELNQLLEKLPEGPPVSSNFTARVLQSAQLETAARERESTRTPAWPAWQRFRAWFPKAAVAGMALGLCFLSYHQHDVNARTALARNVVELTDAVSASDPELMGDFEAISRLSDPQPKADIELIALMK